MVSLRDESNDLGALLYLQRTLFALVPARRRGGLFMWD